VQEFSEVDRRGLDEARERLRQRFCSTPAAVVDAALDEAVASILEDAKVTIYVGLLAEHAASERLRSSRAPLRVAGGPSCSRPNRLLHER
jgi:hypothetical protein